MSKNKLIKRAFLDAFGVIAYISLFSFIINNLEHWTGSKPDNHFLAPVFFLSMFIVSACITGSLVLLKPVLLYLDGQKKEAVNLFLYTIVFLAIMATIVGLSIIFFN
jgi:hypothetical protein